MEMDFSGAMDEVAALRQFSGAPKDFWPRFLSAASRLVSADIAVLLLRTPPTVWTKNGDGNSGSGLSRARTEFTSQLEPIAERCISGGNYVEPSDASDG